MPDFVDRIFVIDDCSADKTSDVTKHWAKGRGNAHRVQLIRHEARGGVGRSITTGYKAALEDGMEVVAVMAGDGQMDPKELPMILEPVADGKADYSKGNRLTSGVAWEKTPHVRYLGNAFLSLLTKIASGYWHVADTQSGYTPISAEALRAINLDDLYPSYGYPKDMLVTLNIRNFRVADVHIAPRYGIAERTPMKAGKATPTVSLLTPGG